MNLSFARRPSVALIGFLAVLVNSFSHGFAAEEVTPDSQGLRLTVDRTTGDYKIAQHGSDLEVLAAAVAAKVDGRWLHARDYPKHTITESFANDDLGIAHEWSVRHFGLDGAPELLCTLHSYADSPFGD